MFSKDLSEAEYEDWLEHHKQAEIALTDRDEKLARSAEAIENELTLLGATGTWNEKTFFIFLVNKISTAVVELVMISNYCQNGKSL